LDVWSRLVIDSETYEDKCKSNALIVDEHLCLKKTAEIGLRTRKLARKMEEVVKGSEAIVKRLHKRLLKLSHEKGHQPMWDCDDCYLQFADWAARAGKTIAFSEWSPGDAEDA